MFETLHNDELMEINGGFGVEEAVMTIVTAGREMFINFGRTLRKWIIG